MAQKRRRVRLDDKGRRKEPAPAPDEPTPAEAAAEEEPRPPAQCDCPRLDADDWHEVESDWSDIQFLRAHTNAALGVPVGFQKTRDNLREQASAAGATLPEDAMLLLGDGKVRRPVMLEVEDAPEGTKGLVEPGGVAFTVLFEAPWGQLRKLATRARLSAKERLGREPDDLWVWYLTCGECSDERNFESLFVAHYRDSDG